MEFVFGYHRKRIRIVSYRIVIDQSWKLSIISYSALADAITKTLNSGIWVYGWIVVTMLYEFGKLKVKCAQWDYIYFASLNLMAFLLCVRLQLNSFRINFSQQWATSIVCVVVILNWVEPSFVANAAGGACGGRSWATGGWRVRLWIKKWDLSFKEVHKTKVIILNSNTWRKNVKKFSCFIYLF